MPAQTVYDVAIIGGGASGLAAAVCAARAGRSVVVIERDVELGLPILATGNGRCNLSNTDLDPARYRHPDIARAVMGKRPEAELAAFFDSLGLMTCEVDGRLYPYSKRADSVREALLMAAAPRAELRACADIVGAVHNEADACWNLELSVPRLPLGARLKPGADFRGTVRAERKALEAAARHREHLLARHVIIACGGSSAETAALFGLPHRTEEPVLCPVACAVAGELDALRCLDGLRVEGRLSLIRGGRSIWSEDGEVLFRPYGISGIVAFDLSRRVAPGDTIELDLFPAYAEDDLIALFERRTQAVGSPEYLISPWFCGLLAKDLGALIVHIAEHTGRGHGCASYAHIAKHLALQASGTTEHASAQVRRGGIPFDAVELPSLAIKPDIAPALSICGEALDMDADCGGFNLAWAWLSGLRAGASN